MIYYEELLESHLQKNERIRELKAQKKSEQEMMLSQWDKRRVLKETAFAELENFVRGNREKLESLKKLEDIGFQSDKLTEIKKRILKEGQDKLKAEQAEKERQENAIEGNTTEAS